MLGISLSACGGKERQFIAGSGGSGVGSNAGDNGLGGAPAAGLNPRTDDGGIAEQLTDVPLATDGPPLSSPEACIDCAAPATLGQLCANDAECSSGVCAPDADEVLRCCDRACGEVACERCSIDGSCGALPAFASECPEVTCPSDDVCRDFAQAIAPGTCAEAGACASAAECTFDWTPAARGGEACDCNESGCALATTELCTRNEDCSGAACRATAGGASICCAQPCTPGQVCTADGTACELEPVCTNGQVRCSSASYQLCTAGQWVTQRECGALGCDVALGGCRRSAGDACTATSDCGEGACRQTATGARVCCTAACDTACKLCTASGTGCQFLSDDAACGTVTCPGDTTCRDFPNAVNANRCIAGNCGSPAEVCTGTARNSGQSCSNTTLCDSAGNCSVSKRAIGLACSDGTQCLSSRCVDGACCDSPCSGEGQTCATGQCQCDVGFHDCAGRCVRNDSVNTCGASCTACPAAANGQPTCDGARCGIECAPSFNLCRSAATAVCAGNVFGFETGTLEGWEVMPGFSTDIFQFTASNVAGQANSGQFLAGVNVNLRSSTASRRSGVRVPLCALGATTNLAGQTISSFVRAGSQGGIPVGSIFRLSISSADGNEVTVATIDGSTNGIGQLTAWRSLSGSVPSGRTAENAAFAAISLEIPGTFDFLHGFDIDDVRVGD